ncbi:MAG: NADH:ubiquinone reductase (Na(+)-transporting) subunit E, partial [Flavobacteriaceae bacterium]|nr:NADH:ubiquinone reductase (Na(+)-transporting) subunit E [Flavobacteriaceae bacterium]
RGLGITFIITGLMAIGFMSFGGMLTGGDEEVKEEITVKVEASQETENTAEDLADNNIKVVE